MPETKPIVLRSPLLIACVSHKYHKTKRRTEVACARPTNRLDSRTRLIRIRTLISI